MAFQKLPEVYKIVAFTEAKKVGDETTVARETGYSLSHVSNVLRGRRSNTTIVNKAYRLIKDRRQTNLQKLMASA
jgi:predicted transcriptional regulator